MAEFAIEQLAEWVEIENVITETCVTKVDDLHWTSQNLQNGVAEDGNIGFTQRWPRL